MTRSTTSPTQFFFIFLFSLHQWLTSTFLMAICITDPPPEASGVYYRFREFFLHLVRHLNLLSTAALPCVECFFSGEAPVIGSVSPGRFLCHRHLSSVTVESSLRRSFSSVDRHLQFRPVTNGISINSSPAAAA